MLGRLTATGGTRQQIDREEAARALRLLVDPEQGCELRGITKAPPRNHVRSVVCMGNDHEGLLAGLESLAEFRSIYAMLNPVLASHASGSANGTHIAARRLLFLDIDSTRPESDVTNANEEEHASALAVAETIRNDMHEEGWPVPILIDSGNGYYLLYWINLPNDPVSTELLRVLLLRLKERFDTTGATIDRTVFNAARIYRFPGTWNQKGPGTDERPHRLCRVLDTGDGGALSVEQMQQAAGLLPANDAETVVGAPSPEARPSAFRKPLRATSAKGADIEARAIAYLATKDPGIQGEHGSDPTFDAARDVVYGFDLGVERGLQLLLDHYNSRCLPSWTEAELRHKCEDADTKPYGKPRGHLIGETSHKTNGSYKAKAKKEEEKEDPEWKVRFWVEGETEAIADELEGKAEEIIGGADDSGTSTGPRVFDLYTLGALMQIQFPEPKWIIKDVLSEGLNILAGAPKQGKSMLALNLALTIAGGGKALGDMPVEEASVLYLSLEDKQRRVKARAIKMMRHLNKIDPLLANKIASHLTIATEWPKQHEGGLLMLRRWIERARNPGLVIIDVWNRFAPPYDKKGGGTYQQDSENWGEVKGFLDRRDMSGLVIHHTRKPGAGGTPDDFVAELSGTFGVGGSADGILVLIRSRSDSEATLHITGRDVPDKEIVLRFDPDTLTWISLGTKEAHIGGKVQTAVIAYLKGLAGATAYTPQIADAINQDQDSVRKACNRLANMHLIRKSGNGWAWPGEGGTDQDTPF